MAWARLDDNFHSHPKIVRAGLEATGLHVLALSHCAGYLTDGHVDREWVQRTAGRRAERIAAVLVECDLWAPNGAGWEIHDYLKYNPTRDQVLARRLKDSARKTSGIQ